jgi:hypothetical protein
MNRRKFFLTLVGIGLVPKQVRAMDTAKMQAVATAITNAGYNAEIFKQPDGSWRVRGKSNAMDIPVGNANNLAVAQAVSGMISEIEYF